MIINVQYYKSVKDWLHANGIKHRDWQWSSNGDRYYEFCVTFIDSELETKFILKFGDIFE